jgi:hypothetical protein
MINSISDNASAFAAQALSGQQPANGSTSAPPVLSSVANLLGMSTDDLMTSLKSGSSMSDLAAQKGVSRDDLLAAITQGLQSDASAAATGGPADPSALAGKIADQKGLPGHHHHHHHGGGSPSSSSTDLQQNVADLSTALGISSDELVKAIQSGLAGTTGTGSSSGYGVSASLLLGLQVDQMA